ncbi:hypothetical protein HW555_011980 [Spodoptera exigua]|uniref:Peptidase aspartic putative domain-containing protein n=1 Tax=Spodoptera exigua TaxID=7107 RepID=A0A835G7Z2_SPOEX|nr:hypothetical protein HW555_011980 [Spodoptera exigua]
MSEERELVKKRGSFKGRLTAFISYLDVSCDKQLTSCEVKELQLRMGRIESLYEQYDEVQLRLECMVEDVKAQFSERAEFESQYYKALSRSQELLSKYTNDDKESRRHNTLIHSDNKGASTSRDNNVAHSSTPHSIRTSSPTDAVARTNVTANNLTLAADVVGSSCGERKQHCGGVLLSTALIKLCDQYDRQHIVRALLDSGSTSCFMTEHLCKRLNLDACQVNGSVYGINNVSSRVDLVKFWNLEEVNSQSSKYLPEEKLCEEHFVKNTTRLDGGHFCVRIPLKQSPSVLDTKKKTQEIDTTTKIKIIRLKNSIEKLRAKYKKQKYTSAVLIEKLPESSRQFNPLQIKGINKIIIDNLRNTLKNEMNAAKKHKTCSKNSSPLIQLWNNLLPVLESINF